MKLAYYYSLIKKVAAKICHIQSTAKSGSLVVMLVPQQLTHANMAMSCTDRAGESVLIMDTGQMTSQSAKRVS